MNLKSIEIFLNIKIIVFCFFSRLEMNFICAKHLITLKVWKNFKILVSGDFDFKIDFYLYWKLENYWN